MTNSFNYQVDGKDYQVNIIHKRVKNINYHFKNGVFVVSCSRFTSITSIKSGLDRFARRMIKRTPTNKGETEEYIYIFGQKYDLVFPGEIVLSETTNKMAEIMSAPKYRVKVRKMVSRYGTNSRHTKSITYSLTLLHYAPEIIESVIVHELTHCFVFNHSDNFYRLLYKFCPNYDILRKKLIKAEFN